MISEMFYQKFELDYGFFNSKVLAEDQNSRAFFSSPRTLRFFKQLTLGEKRIRNLEFFPLEKVLFRSMGRISMFTPILAAIGCDLNS